MPDIYYGCQRADYSLGYENPIPCGFPATHTISLDDTDAFLCATDAALFEEQHPGQVKPLPRVCPPDSRRNQYPSQIPHTA